MSQSETIELAPQAHYHNKRDDVVCVPFYIDGMADKDAFEKLVEAINAEAFELRSAGYAVRGLDGITK